MRTRAHWLLYVYCLYLLLPIYWLVNLSLSSNESILGGVALVPGPPTLANYAKVFTNSVWSAGFVNSIAYVVMNTLISLSVALPAAYAFSRFRFLGDRHLFFWLLSNRMAPPAVFLLPFFQLYSAVGLFDTHLAVALAHCLFTVPLAVWILEGFMSAVPRSLDEMAEVDGHSRVYFFFRIFLPVIRGGVGVTVFFCFMFSWVELLLARTLTGSNTMPIVVVMTRTVSASGVDWGLLAAAGVLTILPGLAVVYFVRNHLVRGFALGRV
jgi:glycerol transport system permease protein